MPDGGKVGWYTNWKSPGSTAQSWSDFHVGQLIPWIDANLRTIAQKNGRAIAGLVVQDPYRMGYDGVKTALAVSKGEKVEQNVDTGANLVTKANMAEPKIDALLNPKIK